LVLGAPAGPAQRSALGLGRDGHVAFAPLAHMLCIGFIIPTFKANIHASCGGDVEAIVVRGIEKHVDKKS